MVPVTNEPKPWSVHVQTTRSDMSRPADAPPACRAVYNNAHARLQEASALVFDTETSGFGGCVLNLGWILADESGAELVTCDAAT